MKSIIKLKDDARRHEQKEEWEKAIQVYLQVLQIGEEGDGEVELPLYNRVGDLAVRLGRAKDAVRYYERAADRYAEAGLYNNAIALCNKAMRYGPDRLELLKKLGQFSASQGFVTDARRYFLEYAEKKFVAGEVDEALSALEDFANTSDDADVRELLARRLHAHGRTAEAVAELQRAYALRERDGDHAGAQALRAEIAAMDPGASLDTAPAAPRAATPSFAAPSMPEPQTAAELSSLAEIDASTFDIAPPTQSSAGTVEGLEGTALASSDDSLDFGSIQLTGFESGAGVSDAPGASAADAIDGLETTSFDFGTIDTGAIEDIGLEREETSFDLPTLDMPEAAPLDETEPLPTFDEGEPELEPLPTLDEPDDITASFALPLLGEDDDDEDSVTALPMLGDDEDDDAFTLPTFDADEDASALPAFDDADADAFTLPAFDDVSADNDVEAEDEAGGDVFALPTFDEPQEPSETFDMTSFGMPPTTGSIEDETADEVAPLDFDTDLDAAFALPAFEDADDEDTDETPVDAETELPSVVEPEAEYREPDELPTWAAEEVEPVEAPPYAAASSDTAVDNVTAEDDISDDIGFDAASIDDVAVEDIAAEAAQADAAADEMSGGWTPAMLGGPAAKEAPPVAASRGTRTPPQDDGFVDLGALLADDEEETTRFRVQETAPTGDEDRDFAELLSQFKAKVSEHLSTEDAGAHYDLGLAFKEMGLIDEAIAEFQIALRAGHMRLRVYEELGHCFLQKEQYNIAEKVLRRALEMKYDDELELLGVYYHLGRAYEGMGKREQARDAYERVLGLDINFGDVTERLARL